MEITLDNFKCKTVVCKILGKDFPVPVLKTKHYVSLLRSQFIETKILAKGLDNKEATREEIEEKAEIDREIAFAVMNEMCPEMTQEFFDNEVSALAIRDILAATAKASGLTDEKANEVKEKFIRLAILREEERKKKQDESSSK